MTGKIPYLVLALFFAAVVALRIAAPSDIYQDTDQGFWLAISGAALIKTQPFAPTKGYSVEVVLAVLHHGEVIGVIPT